MGKSWNNGTSLRKPRMWKHSLTISISSMLQCPPSWFSTALWNLLGSTRNWAQCVYLASLRVSLLVAHFSLYFLSFKLLRRQTFFCSDSVWSKNKQHSTLEPLKCCEASLRCRIPYHQCKPVKYLCWCYCECVSDVSWGQRVGALSDLLLNSDIIFYIFSLRLITLTVKNVYFICNTLLL